MINNNNNNHNNRNNNNNYLAIATQFFPDIATIAAPLYSKIDYINKLGYKSK